ncbi:BTAD domain-containing putative transcriptional regulator, partial [Allorhizocola rhizosphaerae]|uniref:BTAD domain-containing putative transcriptional regulator n=1 Tax=Allorhizocola rhizosphaerae TaxID=1872709 RepID=UPI0013C2A3DF
MHEVTVSVLGRMAAQVNGVEVALGGPRQRAVLASVLLASPRSVSMSRIVEDVWDGEEPPSLTTVHAYIAELRRALEPGRKARQAATVLVTEGSGYALRLPPDALDSTVFARLAADGAKALRDGGPVRADELLREALGTWRGPAFADFPDAGFVASEVRRLELLRETALQDLYEAGLALGRHAELVGELTAYTDRHPMAERGWELLALALYRCGLQTDALSAIRRATALLADEFGLDVGPSLRRMETAILRQDPALEFLAQPAKGPQSNLPFPVTDFVGRVAQLRDVSSLLTRARLVTVTGPGGVGKTRLALEVCQSLRSPDGPWFVDLAGLRQPDLVAATVAEALGLPGVATPQRLAAVLGSRKLLLLLDNCEHLVDAVREMCLTVLSGCGEVRVLATSRESLGITGEAVFELGPMGDDGAELFTRRAAAVQPHWQPEPADRPLIERICADLDGIPLAIELAAAQLRVLSLDQIAGSIDDRFGVATAHDLADTIAWSYDLLSPAERELFGRLSAFAGGFDLDAVSMVAGGAEPVLPALSGLVRKSLLQVEHATTPRRYRMLVMVRAFAAGTLSEVDSRRAVARHLRWVTEWAEAADADLRGPQAPALLARLTRDHAETRAALATALFAG